MLDKIIGIGILTIVLVTLKLFDLVSWSWWVIMAPAALFTAYTVIGGIVSTILRLTRKKSRKQQPPSKSAFQRRINFLRKQRALNIKPQNNYQ